MKKATELLSKDDAISILDFIQSSLTCKSEEDLKGLIKGLGQLFEYEYAVCAFHTADNGQGNIRRFINCSYPEEWCSLYLQKGYDNVDPIVKESERTNSPQYWGDTFDRYRNVRTFVEDARDFGLNEGYSYGLKNSYDKSNSLFSFSGKTITRDHRTETILEYVVPHLHQVFHRTAETQKPASPDIQLSPREKEVLKWARDGKSTWEISVILSISSDTVKFHVKNIMQKLQVVSRTQAVAMAIRNGLIGIE